MTTTNAIGVTTPGGVAYSGTTFKGTTLTAYSVLTGSSDAKDFAPLSSLGTAGQVLQSAGAGAPPVWATISIGSEVWTDKNANFTADADNGYFTSNIITATLPAAPAQGAVITITVDDTKATTIQAATGQSIRVGSVVSAVAGTCASTAHGDSITLVYRTTGSVWIADAMIGNWTLS